MAIDYRFSVLELTALASSDGLTNVVQTVTWQCVADDGARAVPAYGVAVLQSPQGNFVNYEDLTEALVLGWVQDSMTDEEKNDLFLDLERQLSERVAPIAAVKPLPWGSVAG